MVPNAAHWLLCSFLCFSSPQQVLPFRTCLMVGYVGCSERGWGIIQPAFAQDYNVDPQAPSSGLLRAQTVALVWSSLWVHQLMTGLTFSSVVFTTGAAPSSTLCVQWLTSFLPGRKSSRLKLRSGCAGCKEGCRGFCNSLLTLLTLPELLTRPFLLFLSKPISSLNVKSESSLEAVCNFCSALEN